MIDTKRQGDVKNGIRNGEAKEPICMTHGHELRQGYARGRGAGWRGRKGRKKGDNFNSIINRIYSTNEKENVD